MDLILSTASGVEECVLDYDFDLDIGDTNDFQINLNYGTWDERIQIGKKVYIPGTEYGGIIKYIQSATNTGSITLKGFTWRGYLAHRIISPPAGSDYCIVSGELNSVIASLVSIPGFRVSTKDTGVNVNYQFQRYVNAAVGLEAMCESVGFRLDLKYVQTETSGYVLVQALPVANYGGTVEYSQDALIDFDSVNNQMGVNHLVCLGKGELKDRIVAHLYADKDGNISQTQTITGIDEVVQVYDNSGAELETLIESGTQRMKDLISKQSFTPSITDSETELYLGDIVSGVDYITGNSVTKAIADKIVKRSMGELSINYKIEGQK